MSKRNKPLLEIAYIAMFSALSIIIGAFLEFPIGDTGLKIDLSEIIILIAYLIVGFRGSLASMGLRGLVRYFFTPIKTGIENDPAIRIIGEVIAVVASLLIILSFIIAKKILKIKQRRLIDEQNPGFNFNHNKKHLYWVFPLVSLILLPVGLTAFHMFFTAPFMFSGMSHYTIFTFLSDPAMAEAGHTFLSMFNFVVVTYFVFNIIKAAYSSIIFIIIKPRVERVMVKDEDLFKSISAKINDSEEQTDHPNE